MEDSITIKDLYMELINLRKYVTAEITLCRDRRDVDIKEIDQKLLFITEGFEQDIKELQLKIESTRIRKEDKNLMLLMTGISIMSAFITCIIGILIDWVLI